MLDMLVRSGAHKRAISLRTPWSERIEQIGTAMTFCERLASRFVVSFFGSPSMSFLHGTKEVQAIEVERQAHFSDLETEDRL